ncbi:MAG TPA: YncE family protein, partial [Thermoplasmata archaeon]|nr:YncE family protein [Thermoplasmata archaeon]
MRLHSPAALSLAVTPLAVLVLVALLLVGGAPTPAGGTSHAAAPFGSRVGDLAQAATPSLADDHRPATSTAPTGQVVASPLLNYNTTLPGNFGSTVWDWSVGPGTLVPATGDIWFSDNLTQLFQGAPPASAPAIVYDPANHSFSGIVPQLANTSDLLYDPANGWIYSADPLNNTVGVFNPATGAWLRTFSVGTDPVALALDAANSILFVANSGSDNLTLINTSSGLESGTSIATASPPVSLAVDAAHSQVFVACSGSRALYSVNATTDTIAKWATLTANAGQVAVSEPAGTVAVTVPSTGRVYVANAATSAIIAILSVSFNSRVVVTSPGGNEFVIAEGRGLLATVNASTATVTDPSIPVGGGPAILTADSSTGLVYSWSPDYRNLTPVNPNTGAVSPASPTLGGHPVAAAYDPSANRLFVADALTDSLYVLSPTTFASLVAPIHLPGQPYALADDPATSTIYVGLNGSVVTVDALTAAPDALNVSFAGINGVLQVDMTDGLLWDLNNLSGLVAYHLAPLTVALSPTVPPAHSIPGSLALDPTTDQLYAT